MSETLSFDANSGERKTFLTWCAEIAANKGARARVRRCSTLEEAMRERSVVLLGIRLGTSTSERVATMALLASQCGAGAPGTHPARAFGMNRPGGGGPKVSELRFRRLLGAEGRDELLPLLRRALILVDGKVDLGELAESVWFWSDLIKRRWAENYYAIAKLDKSR